MNTQVFDVRVRILIASICAVVAVLLYVPAESKATAYHAYYGHFAHPFESTAATLVILALCVASVVAALPIVRRGSMWQRLGVAFVLLLPGFIAVRFLLWVAHQWSVG